MIQIQVKCFTYRRNIVKISVFDSFLYIGLLMTFCHLLVASDKTLSCMFLLFYKMQKLLFVSHYSVMLCTDKVQIDRQALEICSPLYWRKTEFAFPLLLKWATFKQFLHLWNLKNPGFFFVCCCIPTSLDSCCHFMWCFSYNTRFRWNQMPWELWGTFFATQDRLL